MGYELPNEYTGVEEIEEARKAYGKGWNLRCILKDVKTKREQGNLKVLVLNVSDNQTIYDLTTVNYYW